MMEITNHYKRSNQVYVKFTYSCLQLDIRAYILYLVYVSTLCHFLPLLYCLPLFDFLQFTLPVRKY